MLPVLDISTAEVAERLGEVSKKPALALAGV
jgi:hypothetical protein